MRIPNICLRNVLMTFLFIFTTTLVQAQEHPGILLPGSGQQQTQPTRQAAQRTAVPQVQQVFFDEDSLHSASMYQVIERVTKLTFTGGTATGGSIALGGTTPIVGNLLIDEDPAASHCCPTCVTKAYVELHFHLGGDKHTYEQGAWGVGPYQIVFQISLKNGSNPPVFTTSPITLELSQTKVEQVYRFDLAGYDMWLCENSGTVNNIDIIVNSFTPPGGTPPTAFVRLDADVHEEYKVSVLNCTEGTTAYVTPSLADNNYACFAFQPTPVGLPVIYNNPVRFSWTLPIIDPNEDPTCPDEFPTYQIQILRLYNIDPSTSNDSTTITAQIDWQQALTLFVQGKQKEITLTLPEKIGYYAWRVRPIGNYYGGITHPKDWGNWSMSPPQGITTIDPYYRPAGAPYPNINTVLRYGIFFYDPTKLNTLTTTQFDHFKNWSYSRAFTEDDLREPKIFESITYTDGLGQPEQQQAVSSADNTLQTQQYVYDYTGRPSTQLMPAPVARVVPEPDPTHPHLNYIPELTTSAPGVLYSPADVDAAQSTTPTEIPASSLSHAYYSNTNPDISVPDANGYPFSQSRYYPDGRVKEVSGVGAEHSFNGGRTSKIYYSGVTESELVSVFGAEAPDPSSVSKVVTIDPDNVASVQYVNKEGQTIATCLVNNGELDGSGIVTNVGGYSVISADNSISLLNLKGEKVNALTINDEMSGGEYVGSGRFSTSKSYTILKPTTINLEYQFTPPVMVVNGCVRYCADCKSKVKIQIRNRETNTVIHTFTPELGPPNPLCGQDGPAIQTFSEEYTFPPNAPPGTYIVERIVEDGTPQPSFEDYLGTSVPTLDEIYINLFNINPLDPSNPLNGWPKPTNSNFQTRLEQMLRYFNANYGNNPNTAVNFYPKNINDKWFDVSSNLYCDRLWLLKQYCEFEGCGDDPSTDDGDPNTDGDVENIIPDFELYLFREVSNDRTLMVDPVTGNSSFDLNNYFKRWDNGENKFPTVTPYGNYGRQMFNTIITNMLAENTGMCIYDCKKLWDAWRSAVFEYKIARDEGTLSTAKNGIYFDLLELFLDKAGRKLCERIDPLHYPPNQGAETDNFYDTDDGYLRRPYKFLPIAESDPCYNVPVDFAAYPCCPTEAELQAGSQHLNILKTPARWAIFDKMRQCLRAKQINLTGNKFFKERGISICEQPTTPFDMNDDLWKAYLTCIEKLSDHSVEDCSTRCEQRRKAFTQIVLDAFAHPIPNPAITPTPTPKYLVGSYRPVPLGSSPGSPVHIGDLDKLLPSELQCKVEALMTDCKAYCLAPTIRFSSTGEREMIYDALLPEYQKRMNSYPKVDVFSAGNCIYGGGNSSNCTNGYDRFCHEMLRMKALAEYLNEKYIEKSNSLSQSKLISFGVFVQEYLLLHGLPIPACFEGSEGATSGYGSGFHDLDIMVYPKTKGRFEVIEIPGCGCYLEFHGEEPYHSVTPHPWITELNSYFNDTWGMKLTTPGVMSPDSSNTSTLNPNGYYTMMPYNSGDSTAVFYSAIEDRASQLVNKLRFYNINGRTDSARAFIKLHTLDSIGAGPTTLGVVLTNLRDVIHVSNPTDSLRNDTWRSYNIGLSLPVPTPNLISGKGINISIHGAGKTGTNLDSIGFTHSPSHSGLTSSSTLTLYSPDTEYRYPSADATEVTTIAAAPEVEGAAKFTDMIGRFEQSPDGYLAYRDLKTNELFTYEYIKFTYTYTKLIGGEDCSDCTKDVCGICVRWGDEIELEEHEIIKYRALSCEERKINAIKHEVAQQYNKILKKHREQFNLAYQSGCRSGIIKDLLKVSFNEKLYHYTLYYYDRNSNLVQTVPPKGVDIPQIPTPSVPERTRGDIPAHANRTLTNTPAYSSTYAFNTLKLPIEENTVDGGMTQFAYSPQRLLRFSQNARQATPNGENHKFSYTNYDQLGRVIESGEFSIASTTTFANIQSQALTLGLNALPTGATRTYYTQTFYSTAGTLPAPYTASSQRNLRNRVSYTFTSNDASSIGDAGGRNAYTYYSYDPHGNVEWVIHDQQANSSDGGNNRLASKIDYTYDLISGKVNTLTFRVGYSDRFFHRYSYDRNDRLAKVETSRDGVIWDNDGSYEYFKHGPVKRLTIGEDSLQGIDYTYTLQGWLKAINHPALASTKDPGGDGDVNTATNTAFAKDAYGMTLNYYPGDFQRTLGTETSMFNSAGATPSDYLAPTYPLYGGNITSWSEKVYTPPGMTSLFPNQQTGSIFKYDVLQRIKTEAFQVLPLVGTNPTFAPNTSYDTKYSYDGNGNLTNLHRRTAVTGATPPMGDMDNLIYDYQPNNNKLDYVDDSGTNPTIATADLEAQTGGNYNYDATGNLTSDVANGITGITWTPLNKVAQVTKTGGITITYTYDATGKCILKTVDAPGTADDKSTSYVYDAAGQQLLAVYEKTRLPDLSWSNPMLKEAPIYGSSRLGMMLPNEDRGAITGIEDIFTRTLEKKNYELTDHLGNVRSVITDMKIPDGNDKFLPEATTRNYYYPFGMERPLMTASTGTQSYRYGYNGMEKDNAVSPAGVTGANYSTDFREIDTRIGRWWSRDPIVKPWESPYVTFGDNPIAFADPSGLDPVEGGGSGGNSNSSSFVGPPAPREFRAHEVIIEANGPSWLNRLFDWASNAIGDAINSVGTAISDWWSQPMEVGGHAYNKAAEYVPKRTISKNQFVGESLLPPLVLAGGIAAPEVGAGIASGVTLGGQLESGAALAGYWARQAYLHSEEFGNFALDLAYGYGTGSGAPRPGSSQFSLLVPEKVTAQEVIVQQEGTAQEVLTSTTNAVTTYWPPNNGAVDEWGREYLMPGTVIDRFGSVYGKFFSPAGTPMTMRALSPGNSGVLNTYMVMKPFEVQSSIIAPAFGEIGGGKQYLSPVNMKTLLEWGIIAPNPF